jgi:hypothetical protein
MATAMASPTATSTTTVGKIAVTEDKDNGAGIGIETSQNGRASGSWNSGPENKGKTIASLRGLQGWDLVVLTDQSDMVGDGGGYLNPRWREPSANGLPAKDTIYMRYSSGLTSTMPIKINASLLPNVLAQKNTILEAVVAYDDNLMPDKIERRRVNGGIRPENWNHSYLDLWEAALAVLPQYRGRKNAAIVIGSEFEWLSRESTEEAREQAQDTLLSFGLPIFLISLGARPDDWARETAKNSGGGYLGYLSAGLAKTMSKDEARIWTYIVVDGEPRYDRREAREAKSAEIINQLDESNQTNFRRLRNNHAIIDRPNLPIATKRLL